MLSWTPKKIAGARQLTVHASFVWPGCTALQTETGVRLRKEVEHPFLLGLSFLLLNFVHRGFHDRFHSEGDDSKEYRRNDCTECEHEEV